MSNWVIGMLPAEIQLVFFFFECFEALVAMAVMAVFGRQDPSLAATEQSGINGLLFIVSFRLTPPEYPSGRKQGV